MMRLTWSIAISTAIISALGCGGTSESLVVSRETASAAVNEGQAAFDNRDYAAAADKLGIAVNSGMLNADIYSDAAVKLAVSYGATGKYNEALTLLTSMEQGAPNLDQVFAARAFVLKKQGKVAEANAAMARARQHNRMIKEFM
jgi:lipopolysaccharide biosynthesis regulator YciM